jgi:Carboxypeptidase regulatory-like domain
MASVAERGRAPATSALALVLVAFPAHGVEVGAGERARPALHRVGVVEPGKPGTLSVASDLSAGVTESLSDTDAAHARFAARAAATVDATRWLNVGAWVGGRYDRHPSDAHGSDDGFLLQPELSARLGSRSGALGLGFEMAAWLPAGDDIGASFSGLSADGRLLVSAQASRLLVAGYAGYRLDRSARAAGDAARLRFGDRSALGVSDFDAVLAGVGVGYPAGRTLLFGEVAAQLLLGSPKIGASPLWLSVGARRPLGPVGMAFELSLDALLSSRPDVGPGAELFPIEPRVTLNVGLRYRFGEQAPSRAPALPPAALPAVVVAPKPAPAPATVELELLDDRGQPLQRAQVAVKQGETETPLTETSPGHYRLANAHPGRARLRVQADGFRLVERDIELKNGVAARVDVKVEQALPAGQVRGLVRSFRGKPLAASVRLEPGGSATKTDAEGFFQIDVPPGDYEVVIEAVGYQSQRRKAKVEKQGVVIVNADLSQ